MIKKSLDLAYYSAKIKKDAEVYFVLESLEA
jgi:hypothetical protein